MDNTKVVDYLTHAQSHAKTFADAFEDFLSNFKAAPKPSSVAHALGDMTIDEDDFSDEDDLMEEDDDQAQARRRTRAQEKEPRTKYMDILQKVADRRENEVTIELDDVAKVCWLRKTLSQYANGFSMTKCRKRMERRCIWLLE